MDQPRKDWLLIISIMALQLPNKRILFIEERLLRLILMLNMDFPIILGATIILLSQIKKIPQLNLKIKIVISNNMQKC